MTNTVWWQDFPLRNAADLSSLFIQVSDGEVDKDSKSDFAAQLAGFMASLVIDVPSQAHWIIELTKYNFGGAMGHLITSVPGIHSCRPPNVSVFVSDACMSPSALFFRCGMLIHNCYVAFFLGVEISILALDTE